MDGVLQGIGAYSLRGLDPITCKFYPNKLNGLGNKSTHILQVSSANLRISCKFRQRCPLRIARLGARKKLHATLRELAGPARLLQHTGPTQLESSSAGTEPTAARMGSRRAATNIQEKSLD